MVSFKKKTKKPWLCISQWSENGEVVAWEEASPTACDSGVRFWEEERRRPCPRALSQEPLLVPAAE